MGLSQTEIIPAKPAMDVSSQLTCYASMIFALSYLIKVNCQTSVNFLRKDVRLSVSNGITKTDYCSMQEECAYKCLIDSDCGSVRIYKLTEGFLSERLAFVPDVERRIYKDLNGKRFAP